MRLFCLLLLARAAAHEGHHEDEDDHHLGLPPGTHLVTTSGGYLPQCNIKPCDGPLQPFYCYGHLLSLTWHFYNQNNCTQYSLIHELPQTSKALGALGKTPSYPVFDAFCKAEFNHHSGYLTRANLSGWTPDPPPAVLAGIADPDYRDFAKQLHRKWKRLARKFRLEVSLQPERYPVFHVKRPFVVPGGSFQIYFYWDSYWILKGLLFSHLHSAARDIILNFNDLLKEINHIPNGGMLVLGKRSQPPYFPRMVKAYVDATKDTSILGEVLTQLDEEAHWWLDSRSRNVSGHTLFHFDGGMDCPRPEGYAQDIRDATISGREPTKVWRDIAAGAESGWDYSTRWFAWNGRFTAGRESIMTTAIAPVDLNAVMCGNFRILADFHRLHKTHDAVIQLYEDHYADSRKALEEVFWHEKDGIWYDQEILPGGNTKPRRRFYASNFQPLEAGCFEAGQPARVASYAKHSGAFDYPGGVPTSLEKSGQQWDFPNAWAPLIHTIVTGFRRSGDAELEQLGRQVADEWIRSMYRGFQKNGSMWEKYDATKDDGSPGSGGEYEVQEGFGWSNGAVLDLLSLYGGELGLDRPVRSLPSRLRARIGSPGIVAAAALFAILVVIL